jgi:hypothetical protein
MKKHKILIILFIAVILIQAILAIIIKTQLPDWTTRGTFGDMFGAVNTLFSGLAFAGVIYTILLQGEELSLQRQELSLTREELSKSAAAQIEQSETLLRSAKINALSSQLDMYTTLLVNNRSLPYQTHTQTGDGVANTLKELKEMLDKQSKQEKPQSI